MEAVSEDFSVSSCSTASISDEMEAVEQCFREIFFWKSPRYRYGAILEDRQIRTTSEKL
jgi:hypothetical protein